MTPPFPELEPVFAAVRNGHLDQALAIATNIAETADGPLALEARRHVGLCLFHLGDYASAVPHFQEVAEARRDRQSWFVLALARTLAGDPSGGAQDFEAALAAPEPPPEAGERQLTEHFMRFDYMHVLADTWQWEAAKEQLDRLTDAVCGLSRHDNAFLVERGYPVLQDLLQGGLRVLEIVPDSNPIQWLTRMRRSVDADGRKKVDQALVELARRIGPPEQRRGGRGN